MNVLLTIGLILIGGVVGHYVFHHWLAIVIGMILGLWISSGVDK